MAPKIVVPADFGIENLHSRLHGNIKLNLQEKRNMTANSMILSYNSPVFLNIFFVLEQSVVEMDDFNPDVVNTFIESLYCGEVELQKESFRDINKMSHVFKVEWVGSKCLEYYKALVKSISQHSDYSAMMYVFEEARYAMTAIKNDCFIKLIVEKIHSLEYRGDVFIEPYMRNYTSLATNQLDLMIQVAGEDVSCLVKIIKRYIEKQDIIIIDENSRYLLQRIDLVKCLESDAQLYETFFDLLMENWENFASADTKMIMSLNRHNAKEYYMKSKGTNLAAQVAPNKISNIFSTFNGSEFETLLDTSNLKFICGFDTLDQCIDYWGRGSSDCVKNLYMFMEALNHFASIFSINNNLDEDGCISAEQMQEIEFEALSSKQLQKIEQVRVERGWSKISAKYYLPRCKWLCGEDFNAFQSSETTECVYRYSKLASTVEDFFFKEQKFTFQLKHPQTTKCSLPGKCGFILKVTPMTVECPELFNIELCVDPEEYNSDDLHIHTDLIRPENLHLMLRMYCRSRTWANKPITWKGRPELKLSEDGTAYDVSWGYLRSTVKLDGTPTTAKLKLAYFYSF